MKKYINRQIVHFVLLLITAAFITVSCESFVDAGPPKSQLSGEVVFDDIATARAALGNCYALLCNNVVVTGGVQGITVMLGNYADEIIPYGSGQADQAFFQNNLTPQTSDITAIWNSSYNLIYSLNDIIEGVEASSGISPADREILIGEALLMRSLLYFHLTNLFGAVPYITTTDYTANVRISKTATDILYKKLEEDLTLAYHKLPEDYGTYSRTTPNKSVASALLARLYLYAGNWELAAGKAQEVISNAALYSLEPDLAAVFLKDSRSTLWQLSPTIEGMPTLEGQSFIFTMGPPPARSLNPVLVDAFEAGDNRKEQWVGTVIDGESVWHYPYKYKQNTTMDVSSEYSVLIRLEEMYLIRAEARAWTGDTNGAREDLNIIRNRAGLPNTTATTPSGLRDAIREERRFEFFCEQGHRWFDLKRMNVADSVLSQSKPGWNPIDFLWPLPQNELLLNPALLPQNPGY